MNYNKKAVLFYKILIIIFLLIIFFSWMHNVYLKDNEYFKNISKYFENMKENTKKEALKRAVRDFEDDYGQLTFSGGVKEIDSIYEDKFGATYYYMTVADSNKQIVESYIYIYYEGDFYSFNRYLDKNPKALDNLPSTKD
ncbi:MAG: hypothetical protein ACOCV1_05235 [Bacillota bacterium]